MSTNPSHSSSNDVKLPMYLVHSDLDEYGLDPYEFRVYAHIVRRTGGKLTGACFSKLELMAKICKMSVRKTQAALQSLCDAGLIIQEKREGRTDIYKLTPKTTWKQTSKLDK